MLKFTLFITYWVVLLSITLCHYTIVGLTHISAICTNQPDVKLYGCNTGQYVNASTGKESELMPFVQNTSHLVIMITTWRSGSTFTSHMLSLHPGTWELPEPLHAMGIVQIDGGDLADEAMIRIRNNLNCQMGTYQVGLPQVKIRCHKEASGNTTAAQQLCCDPTFLQQTCAQSPIRSMKVVRLRLNLTRSLLEDPVLNQAKIILLVRDPRATIASRLSRPWCTPENCISPARLCEDLDNDLDAYDELVRLYPTRVTMVKYESVAKYPVRTFKSLYNFIGIPFTQAIRKEIVSCTQVPQVDSWKDKLDSQQIEDIRESCYSVLQRLKYPFYCNNNKPYCRTLPVAELAKDKI